MAFDHEAGRWGRGSPFEHEQDNACVGTLHFLFPCSACTGNEVPCHIDGSGRLIRGNRYDFVAQAFPPALGKSKLANLQNFHAPGAFGTIVSPYGMLLVKGIELLFTENNIKGKGG